MLGATICVSELAGSSRRNPSEHDPNGGRSSLPILEEGQRPNPASQCNIQERSERAGSVSGGMAVAYASGLSNTSLEIARGFVPNLLRTNRHAHLFEQFFAQFLKQIRDHRRRQRLPRRERFAHG